MLLDLRDARHLDAGELLVLEVLDLRAPQIDELVPVAGASERRCLLREELYQRVYRKMYDRLKPLYEDIMKITGYPRS